MKRKIFLRWVLLMIGLLNILVVVFLLGLYEAALVTGVGTAIIAIIMTLFIYVSIRSGVDSFKLSTLMEIPTEKKKKKKKKALKKIKDALHINKFASGLSMGLGMLGTVCGLILMFSGIDQNIDPANYQANIQLLKAVSAGFSTALYTTLVGLASSILLVAQAFNIEYEIKKDEKDEKDEDE